MVVNLHIVTLDEVIAVKLHLLTGDTRACDNSVLHLCTVGDGQFLNLVKALGLCCNSSVEDVLSQLDVVSTVGNEVSLALESHDSSEAVNSLNENTTVRSLAVRTLGSDSLSLLTDNLHCLVEVTLCVSECLLHISEAGTGHGAQLLDVFHIWFVSHNCLYTYFSLLRIKN